MGSCSNAAGLMFGPALLGLLADFTSVQTALCANATALAAVMGLFALAVRQQQQSTPTCASAAGAHGCCGADGTPNGLYALRRMPGPCVACCCGAMDLQLFSHW